MRRTTAENAQDEIAKGHAQHIKAVIETFPAIIIIIIKPQVLSARKAVNHNTIICFRKSTIHNKRVGEIVMPVTFICFIIVSDFLTSAKLNEMSENQFISYFLCELKFICHFS